MSELLPDDECQVWWASVGPDQERLITLLDNGERDRAARMRHAASRALYVLAHATVRLVMARLTGQPPAALVFTATCRRCAGKHGRPRLELDGVRWRLSLSHSGERVVVAVARDVEIGVDVEQIAVRGGQLPVRALAADEHAALDALPESARLPAFIRYWTRKEALLKATGDGLMVDPATITVSAPNQPPALLAWPGRPAPLTDVHLMDLSAGAGHLATAAMLDRQLRIVERDAAPLLRAG